ncbi:polyprenyl synthetase [Methanocella sp. CWC-04]|uniref:Polyprenyl synthetase n=1 Tax=Methanooceanicella nereidis TaxID=2052831 RepID=A0AAP2REF5_9EURY|nr:polyprenyl synthetase family protein [Methanocella sp. CWC-04]MCD1294550.1 polyprenyl synthetase [Methanocella sp. CWC-04]
MVDQVTSILKEYSVHTDNKMNEIVESRKRVGHLYDMMKYHLGWMDENFNLSRASGGKQLRSTMCLLSCEAISGDFNKALPAAAGLELIHNFSLIHDDIEDGDEKRRHRDTLWKVWGVPQAINTGDAMDVIANIAILSLEDTVKPKVLVSIMKVFNDMVIRLCEGQYLDMDFQTREEVTVDEYIEMISGKTAALIEASTGIGAMIATEDADIIDRFKTFGFKIGIAFQIQDDILGIWGDPATTGKSAKNDIRNKKKSLPVLYAMQTSAEKEELKNLYRKETLTEDDISRIYDILTAAGSLEYTQSMANRYKDEAMSRLEGLYPGSEPMKKLHEIGKFLVERDY